MNSCSKIKITMLLGAEIEIYYGVKSTVEGY